MPVPKIVTDAKGDVRTEAQAMHPDFTSAPSGEPILTASGTSERLPEGHDPFYIGPAERKRYGIPDNMEVAWIRDDRWWENKVPGNREGEFIRENGGEESGACVWRMNGKPVACGTDLVLAVRPKALVDAHIARETAELKDFERRVMAAQSSEVMDDDDFDRRNRDKMEQRKLANTRKFQQAGMIGNSSPSQGQNLEDYIRNRGLSAEDVLNEELTYAKGRNTSVSIDDLKQIGVEMGILPKSSGGKNTSYSLPPNVRPRNLAKS